MGGTVLVGREGAVARLTLNRPEKRNALSAELVSELKAALRDADADDGIRVVAITGAGKDFCSGADLSALRKIAGASVMENLADVDDLAELFLLPRRMKKPVVACVRGRALAGGCGLATACDLVLASADAQFGYPETRIGFVPAMVMAITRRNVSEKRAFDLLVRGLPVSAAEAERIGLINQVFAGDAFDADPLGPDRRGFYPLVTTHYCAEGASCSREAWRVCMRNILSLVKPGGTLILSACGAADFYSVGGRYFPCAGISAQDVLASLGDNGFTDIDLRVRQVPDHSEQGYGSVLFARAVKAEKAAA